jgi:Imidazoleglycerol-phosphate synthase
VHFKLRNIRLIARLDIKSPNLVKGIQLEGLRKIGNPNDFAKKYYDQGIDEIYYEDIVASLYERNSLLDIIKETTKNVFVPITVGGGLRSINDVGNALRAGADKVAINTAAIKNPELITQVAEKFGSQCMVVSIQAKKNNTFYEALL